MDRIGRRRGTMASLGNKKEGIETQSVQGLQCSRNKDLIKNELARCSSEGTNKIEKDVLHEKLYKEFCDADGVDKAVTSIRDEAKNSIRLKIATNKSVYQFEVSFNPDIEDMRERREQIKQAADIIGDVYMFDGYTLYLPQDLIVEETNFKGVHLESGNLLNIKIVYIKKVSQVAIRRILKILFNKLIKTLNTVAIEGSFYDIRQVKRVSTERIDIWTGFQYFVKDEIVEIKFCNMIIQRDTVFDVLKSMQSSANTDAKLSFKSAVIGRKVITEYNNLAYVIDNVDFSMTPLSTFMRRGEETTFEDYYLNEYGLRVVHIDQPMLVSKVQKPDKSTFTAHLLPEQTNLIGLTTVQAAVMDEQELLKNHLTDAVKSAQQWITSWNSIEPAQCHIKDWGLQISLLAENE